MEPSRVWVFVSIDYGIIDYSECDRGYNWLYHNEWTVNLQHQNKNSSSYIPSHLSMSCTKILGNSLFYCTIRVSKSFVSFSPNFSLSPPPTYQPQRCFFRCTLKYTDADIIRTDSVQHVEPIAFEHLNVRRQILATVDPCKMKWVLTVRTGNRHLWEIEQLQLWNSLRIEISTVVVVELSENWEFHSRWLGMDNLVAHCTEKTPRSWYMFDCSTYGKTHHVWSILP